MKVEINRVTRGRDDALNFGVTLAGDRYPANRYYVKVYAAPRGYRHKPGSVEFLRYRGMRFYLVHGWAASVELINAFTPAFKAAVAEWLLMQTAAEIEKKLEVLESETKA